MAFSSKACTPFRLGVWLLLVVVDCQAFFNGRMPFVAEETPVILRRKAGCYMDGKHYKFGERWSPVFIPQGLMVCIRCECMPVEKKGVLHATGETMCRNIKSLCPEPSCPTPTLRPGKCCKACVDDEAFEDSFTFKPTARVSNEIFSHDQADDKNQVNDFQALLTGHGLPARSIRTKAVALLRMTYDKGAVRFSLRYERLDRPKYLKLVDETGRVFYQTPVVKGNDGQRKACGIWDRVTPSHLDHLRREKLFAVITSTRHPSGVVGGTIKDGSQVLSETFSSLLVSSKPRGQGAHMTLSFNPKTKMATYSLVTDGVARQKGKPARFSISVLKGSHVVYRTRGTAASKTNKLTGSWRVYKRRHRRQLARGRLRMRVTLQDGQTLTGDIEAKQTCDSFRSVLSSGQTVSKSRSSSAGSAVVKLGSNGRLHYRVRLSNMQRDVTKIKLEGHNSKSRSNVVGKLHFRFDRDSPNSLDGWATGTFKRLEAGDVYRLLNNQLFLSVSTGANEVTDLKGRLVAIGYDEHNQDGAPHGPFALTPSTEAARGGGASVWLSLGRGCVLHFDVLLTGRGKRSGPFGLVLGSHGNESNEMVVLRPPQGQRGEVLYHYRHVTGDALDLPDSVFRDLDRGNAFLQINAKRRGQAVFKANVTVPNKCWHYANDGDRTMLTDDRHHHHHQQQQQQQQPRLVEEEAGPTCRFEDLYYSDGTAWIPDVDAACTTCSCVKGETLCQRMTCPAPTCDDPVQVTGRCCPVCPDEDPSQTCQLGRDPRKYPLHSTWHPYLPSQGFTTCAICTCKPGGKAECRKQPCPVLECPRSEWVPSKNNPCCYECGAKTELTIEDPIEEPQGDADMKGACHFLGEMKADGETWHPNVPPFGHLKCFSCHCKDGQFTCSRLTCAKLTCKVKVKRRGVCCEECAADQSAYPNSNDLELDRKQLKGQGVCIFAGKDYQEGERWRPLPATPSDNTDCAVCKCVNGSSKCRLRCPKVCATDKRGHKCCKHCPEKDGRRMTSNKKKRKKKKKSKKKGKSTLDTTMFNDDLGDNEVKSNKSQGQTKKIRRRKGQASKGSRSRHRKVKLASSKTFLSRLKST